MLRQIYSIALLFSLVLTGTAPVQAGVVPWAWDALFGPPGSQIAFWNGAFNGGPVGGYGYGPPAYGGGFGGAAVPSTSFYGPASYGYLGYTANYAPSYVSTANYGYSPSYGYVTNYRNNCGCDPCGGGTYGSLYGSVTGVANSSCGSCVGTQSQYSPSPKNPAEPEPEPAGTPTFKPNPPIDEFNPSRGINPNETGNGTGLQPLGNESDEVVPGGGSVFPPPRRPADAEPSGGTAPLFPGTQYELNKPEASIEPIDIKSTVAQSYQPQRRRIESQAGFRIPSVARVKVTPSANTSPTQLAAN